MGLGSIRLGFSRDDQLPSRCSLAQVTDSQDILVINFGLWSNSMDELKLHVGMFEAAFEYHRHNLPNRTFWRETSAQHYSTLNGERTYVQTLKSIP